VKKKKEEKEGRKVKKRTDVGQTGKNIRYLRGSSFPRLILFIYIEKSTKRGSTSFRGQPEMARLLLLA